MQTRAGHCWSTFPGENISLSRVQPKGAVCAPSGSNCQHSWLSGARDLTFHLASSATDFSIVDNGPSVGVASRTASAKHHRAPYLLRPPPTCPYFAMPFSIVTP